ncbi:MAG: hypothetical protein JHC26_01555 [Thermofilum sp.]|jgi:hypothetical protein|uniref:hypothetical protein n=1 Tax=Thermofilum sp. TaxID=1961369 RepID=UPI002590BB28|nr:hypothetical protein [Thermofilum sp.]MCI4407747.1 hypothetical protein [Thermofilum sp.]
MSARLRGIRVIPKREEEHNKNTFSVIGRGLHENPVSNRPATVTANKTPKNIVTLPERELVREIPERKTPGHGIVTIPEKELLRNVPQPKIQGRGVTRQSANVSVRKDQKKPPQNVVTIPEKEQLREAIERSTHGHTAVTISEKEQPSLVKEKVFIEVKPSTQQEFIRGWQEVKEPVEITPEKAREMVEKLKELVMTKGVNDPEVQRLIEQIKTSQSLIPVPITEELRELLEK